MSIDLKKIQGQVREVLKSIGAIRDGHAATAAAPPADPDALDQRLDGAAPTAEGMADAGAEAAAGQQGAGGEGGEEGAEEGSDSGSEGGEDEGDGRPIGKALPSEDPFGNHDFTPEEIRSLEKSYGNGTGQEEPSDLLKGGADLEGVLEGILHAMEDQNVVIRALQDEVASLKAGQTATNRKLSKALSDLAPQPILPPQPVAKAITKALPSGGGVAPSGPLPLTPDEIFSGLRSGKLSQDEALASVRLSRSAQ